MYFRWSRYRNRKIHTQNFWISFALLAFVCICFVLWEKSQNTPIESSRHEAEISLLNQHPHLFHKSATGQGQEEFLLPIINLAVVSCGIDKLDQAVTMIKSALLFSHDSTLRIFAFADKTTITLFEKYLENLQKEFRTTGLDFVFEIKLAIFPPEISGMQSWAEIFKPCSILRLFLPSLLPNIDSLIYLDADVLILSNLTVLWNHFENMNSLQLIGLSHYAEFPLPPDSWFLRYKIPVHTGRGLNCGIALMNLTKMRLINFEEKIVQVRKNYEHLRPNDTGDQFLQSILYGQHPEYVFILSCDWNLHMSHCNCNLNQHCECTGALSQGVSAIHGMLDAFSHPTRFPFFRHIYEIIKVHDFRTDSMNSLLGKLQAQFELEESSLSCFFNSSELFYSKFKKYVNHVHWL